MTIVPFLLPPVLALQAPGPLPETLTRHLREAACIHLDFVQTRTLAALTRPLKASGSLVLARDKGIIWELKRPVAITYVMGPGGLLTLNADGSGDRQAGQDTPMAGQVGRVFSAVAQGDWKALEGWFSVAGDGRPEHWTVTLRPKGQADAFVKAIRLEGGAFIDRIRLEEPGGDRTELVFQHQRADLPPSAEEARLLEQTARH